jgi:hypothetical protein
MEQSHNVRRCRLGRGRLSAVNLSFEELQELAVWVPLIWGRLPYW